MTCCVVLPRVPGPLPTRRVFVFILNTFGFTNVLCFWFSFLHPILFDLRLFSKYVERVLESQIGIKCVLKEMSLLSVLPVPGSPAPDVRVLHFLLPVFLLGKTRRCPVCFLLLFVFTPTMDFLHMAFILEHHFLETSPCEILELSLSLSFSCQVLTVCIVYSTKL